MRKEVMILGCVLLILLFVFFFFEKKVDVEYNENNDLGAVAPEVFYYEELSWEELSWDELSLDWENFQVPETLMDDSGGSQITEVSSVDYEQDYPKYWIIEEDFWDDDSFEYAEEDEELLESEKILLEALTSFGESDTEWKDSI